MSPKHFALFNNSDCSTGNVVFVLAQKSWVLGGLSTHQRNIHFLAGLRDPAHDVSNALRVELAGCDVIGHKQAASAGNHDVVHHHANQVLANRVVLVDCLSNRNLGADPIG